MSSAVGAVFVDLDRTLLRGASGPVLHDALVEEGVIEPGQRLPGDALVYGVYERFGESLGVIALARAAALAMRGRPVEATRRAGKRAAEHLSERVQPWARHALEGHRRAGRPLVLATTSPADLVEPLADLLGFDGVVATRYEVVDGHYTGRLASRFTWGTGKRAAALSWAEAHGVGLAHSHAYSDSVYDLPLLSAVGHPHALNPDPRLAVVARTRRWPVERWDRAPGVPSLGGLEPYHVVRLAFRPEAFPYARFEVTGVTGVPERGPVVLAANHRSYFDVAALGIVAARLGRPVRFLAKQEVFDAPVVGSLARSLGGIPVDRSGGRGAEPLAKAVAALRAGEVVIVLPQGTIPRGEAFFDPVLVGRTGVARLAAEAGSPVVPVGLWGTEHVWPRSARLPRFAGVLRPPTVTVRVGRPLELAGADAVADTAAVMAAITDLLPAEARTRPQVTAADVARARPPA
jgi:putative phosphoserine phosphatase/1-acylglycerol-3-phosphate O-acyltransferase